jgi:hypothetical protein
MKKFTISKAVEHMCSKLIVATIVCAEILFGVCAFAQTGTGPQPHWRNIDNPPLKPATKTYNASLVSQTKEESGEDWWYSHINVLDAQDEHIGYLTVGYAGWNNLMVDESDGPFNGSNGCYKSDDLHNNDPSCHRLEDYAENHVYMDPYRAGHTKQWIGRYDINGKMMWCRSYLMGDLYEVVQVDDGFIAIGTTKSTRYYNSQTQTVENLLYNPDGTNNDYFETTSSCTLGEGQNKMSLMKIDFNGNFQWARLYGIPNFGVLSWQSFRSAGVSLSKIEDSDDLILLGYSNQTSVSTDVLHPIIIKVDEDGNILDSRVISMTGNFGGEKEGVIRSHKIGTDIFYYVGINRIFSDGSTYYTHPLIFKWKDDLSDDEDYDLGSEKAIFDFTVSSDGDYLIVPYIYDCLNNACLPAQTMGQAKAKILKLNIGDLSYDDEFNIPASPASTSGLLTAYDLKVGITNTSDDGFAIVSAVSKGAPTSYTQVKDGIHLDNCQSGFGFGTWNTDAYIAKYKSDGSLHYETSFNSDDATDWFQNPYPQDWKHQECLYTITEAPDGGLVITGNTSHNFDDGYFAKTYNSCDLDVEYGEGDILPMTDFNAYILGSGGTSLVQTWNTNKKVATTIVVPDGGQLTIDGATIQFADSRKIGKPVFIKVEKGGRLYVRNGAVLTSLAECEFSMWDGISVEGDAFLAQNYNTQGFVSIVDSRVENVRFGVCASKFEHTTALYVSDHWSRGGGIIQIEDSEFEKYDRAVHFTAYDLSRKHNFSPPVPKFIKNTVFNAQKLPGQGAIDDNGEPRGHRAAISAWGIYHLNFENIEVTNHHSDVMPTRRGHGIITYDTKYELNGSTFGANRFNDLWRGVEDNGTILHYIGSRVENSRFEGSRVGILNRGKNMMIMDNNEFIINRAAPYAYNYVEVEYIREGIYVEDATAYSVQNNLFHSPSGNATLTRGFFHYNNTPAYNGAFNVVNRNNFNQIGAAAEGHGYNQGNNANLYGLKFRCNVFEDNHYDVFTLVGPGISSSQGSSQFGANNVFDQSGCTTLYGQLLNDANHYDYYYDDTPGNIFRPDVSGGCVMTSTVNVSLTGIQHDDDNVEEICVDRSGKRSSMELEDYIAELQDVREENRDHSGDYEMALNYNMAYDELVRMYGQHPEIPNSADSLEALFLEKGDFLSIVYLAELRVAQDEYGMAYALLDSLKLLDDDWGVYCDYRKTLLQWEEDTLSVFEMLKADSNRTFVEALAADSTLPGSMQAKNLLALVDGNPVVLKPLYNYSPKTDGGSPDPRLSTEEHKKAKLKQVRFYPNPTNGTLQIDSGENPVNNWNVFDLQGRIVLQGQKNNTIDMGSLNSGTYVVQVLLENGEQGQELILKK